MDILFESPLLVGGIGIAVLAATIFGFVQTGSKAALYAAIGILLLTVLLVFISLRVETEKEQLTSFIHQTASELENNNHAAILSRIHPNANTTVGRAAAEMPRYEFTVADVTRIHELEIRSSAQPPTAIVKMNVVVEGTFDGFSGRVPRYVEISLEKVGDRWLVTDYQHDEPTKGFRDTGED